MKYRLLLLFFFLGAGMASASHLLGGDFGYTYLGMQNGQFRYAIQLTTYTDCTSGSEIPFPESPLSAGLYENVSGEFKPLLQTLTLQLSQTRKVEPMLPPGCIVPFSICMYEGIYRDTLLLPASALGYILFYERCCRSSQVISLNGPSLQSESFVCTIPPTAQPNSTPVFEPAVLPLVCIGDTLTFPNTAIDPDGDLLIYNWVHPYAGYGIPTNTAPPPPNPLGYEPPLVTYAAGFSPTQPFGPGGYVFLNASSGLTRIKGTIPGSFVIALEVNEFRNNQLLNKTRRELQIAVTQCPQNNPPQVQLQSGSTLVNVHEEEEVCVQVTLSDTDGDSLSYTFGGPVMDLPNPPQITVLNSTASETILNVCFAPVCGQASPFPYNLYIQAVDNGCLPKNDFDILSFQVDSLPFEVEISGPDSVCLGEMLSFGSNVPAGSFLWSVQNGTLTTPANLPEAGTQWNNTGNGSVQLIWQGVCNSDTAQHNLVILPEPQFSLSAADSICFRDTILLSCSNTGFSSYTWSGPGLIPPLNGPAVYALAQQSGYYTLRVSDPLTCTRTDSIYVEVLPLPQNPWATEYVVCFGDSITLLHSDSLQLSIQPNLYNMPDVPGSHIFYPPQSFDYITEFTDIHGCSDTNSLRIRVPDVPKDDIDTSLCEHTLFVYTPVSGAGVQCSWNPLPQELNGCTAEILVSGTLSYEIVLDYEGVCTDTLLLNIESIPNPEAAFEEAGAFPACDGLVMTFNDISSDKDSIQWYHLPDALGSSSSIQVTVPYSGNYTLNLVAYNQHCTDTAGKTLTAKELTDYLQIQLPNIITPNGDGSNDVWKALVPPGFTDCTEIQVFNRWGISVFRSEGLPAEWNPDRISSGVYFLVLKTGTAFHKTAVTVVRE